MKPVSNSVYLFNPGNRLSIETIDTLSSDLAKLLENNDFSKLVIDLHHVTVCDLYGILFLQKAEISATQKGVELTLKKPNPIIADTLINSGYNFNITD